MSAIPLGVDALIKLIEKISEIKNAKFQDQQSLFKEIITPLFMELEPVARQYISTFRKTKKTLTKNSPNWVKEAIMLMGEERESMNEARIKISSMVKKIIENVEDKASVEFAKNADNFFYEASYGYGISFMGRLLNYLKHVEKKDEIPENIKTNVMKYIDHTLPNLEKSWASVVQSYEELKIHSVTPKRFIKKNK